MKIEKIKKEAETRYPWDVEELIYGHTRHTGKYDEYEAFLKGAEFVLSGYPKSIELVCDERLRQINQEGYDSTHDDCETFNQLSNAAIVYACVEQSRDQVANFWQWDMQYFKPSNEDTIDGRIRNLVKAGALICAEIDRLARLKNK